MLALSSAVHSRRGDMRQGKCESVLGCPCIDSHRLASISSRFLAKCHKEVESMRVHPLSQGQDGKTGQIIAFTFENVQVIRNRPVLSRPFTLPFASVFASASTVPPRRCDTRQDECESSLASFIVNFLLTKQNSFFFNRKCDGHVSSNLKTRGDRVFNRKLGVTILVVWCRKCVIFRLIFSPL